MSIETVKKYLAGRNETTFDIERNVDHIKVLRRLYIKNITYNYRDFIAEVSMQDLDYYNKNKVLTPVVPVGKCSVRVANSEGLNEVRIKIIKKFPVIENSMKGDVNNAVKADIVKKANVKDVLKKRIKDSLDKSNIRPSGPLVTNINNFIKEYGDSILLPSVSCSKSDGIDANGRKIERTNVTFRWENKSQNFALTITNEPDEQSFVCRSQIIPNGATIRNMISPVIMIGNLSDAAPIAFALGTPILKNQKSSISLNPAINDGQSTMFKRKGGRRKR